MSSAHHFQSVPVDDYLDGERLANRKHEYVEGFVYAMAGASNAHNRIATNATGSLYSQLRGKDCQVFNSDTKIRIRFSQGTRFYYPDASVVCHPNAADESFQDAPVIILEVISASTRRTDENEKRDAYLKIESLSVYLLVEQNSANVLIFRRKGNSFQTETYSSLDSVIDLPEVDCKLSLAELYDRVSFPSADELLRELESNYNA